MDHMTIQELKARMLEYESALCQIVDCPGANTADAVAQSMRLIALQTLGIPTQEPKTK